MIGAWQGLDGKVRDATGKTFELRELLHGPRDGRAGEIVEENPSYRRGRVPRQIGVL